MTAEAPFGNWMVAVAEAAEMTGVQELDAATAGQLTQAWGLVRKAAGLGLDELAERIAGEANIRRADLDRADSHAARLIPGAVARRRTLMPLGCTDREIRVATANPLGQEARREVAAITGRQVIFEVAPPGEIATAIMEAYGPATGKEDSVLVDADIALPHGPRVLVVDDEAGQRALFRSVLDEAGFRVEVARDGATAVEILDADPDFDLVSLDYWMDRMNGLRVLQAIRSKPATARLPVIMVTGAGDRRIEMSLFEAGADDFITKPIDGPLFVLRVKAVLRRRRLA